MSALAVLGVLSAPPEARGETRFVGRTPDFGPSDPHEVVASPDGRHAYITTRSDGSGSVFVVALRREGRRLRLVQSVISPNPISGGGELVLGPRGRHLYVTDPDGPAVDVYRRSPTTGRIELVEQERSGFGSGELGYGPTDVSVTGDGRHVIVTAARGPDFLSKGQVIAYRRSARSGRLRLSDTFEATADGGFEFARPAAAASDRRGRGIYVGDDVRDEVVLLSLSPGGRLSFGSSHPTEIEDEYARGGPADVEVSPDGKSVHVLSDGGLSTYARRRDGGLKLIQAIADPSNEQGLDNGCALEISDDGRRVHVASYLGTLSTFRRADDGRLLHLGLFMRPEATMLGGISGMTLLPRGASLLVTATESDSVVLARLQPGSRVPATARAFPPPRETPDGPVDLAISPDGRHVYSISLYDGSLIVHGMSRKGRLRWIQTLAAGWPASGSGNVSDLNTLAVAPDGRHVYVAQTNQENIDVYRRSRDTGRLRRASTFEAAVSAGPSPLRTVTDLTFAGNRTLHALGSARLPTLRRDPANGKLRLVDVEEAAETWQEQTLLTSPDEEHAYAAGLAFEDDPNTDIYRSSSTGLSHLGQAPVGSSRISGNTWEEAGSAISPDGRHLYLGGSQLTAAERDPASGGLSLLGTYASGFSEFIGVGIAPGGRRVYTANTEQESALQTFARVPTTGALRPLEIERDLERGVTGLTYPNALAVNPRTGDVVVASEYDDALTVFSRR